MRQFCEQRHRGTEGFGVFDRTKTRLVRATKEKKMLGWLKNHESTSLMFHHRFPTSTRNRKSACHPFSTQNHFDSNYVLIHNGHVSNSRSLRLAHEKLGIEYHSWDQTEGKFNDSEALLWDVALYLEGKQDKLEAYGGIAFVCLEIPKDKRKPTKLHFARNTNPLNLLIEEQTIMLSSEGDGASAKPNTLYSLNYKTLKLEEKELKVPTTDPNYVAPPYTPPTYSYGNYGGRQTFPSTWQERWEDETVYDDGDCDDYEIDGPNDDVRDNSPARSRFQLLPADEDFTWDALYPIREEVEFKNFDGQIIQVRKSLVDKIDTYLEAVDGEFMSAQTLMSYDIHVLRRQLDQDRDLGFVDDEDLILEMDLLMASRDALDTNFEWDTPEAVDKRYATV